MLFEDKVRRCAVFSVLLLGRSFQPSQWASFALLALGVSYTNELDQTRALHHLQHWLESHPEFAGLELPKAGGAAAAAAAGGPEAAAAAARYGNP